MRSLWRALLLAATVAEPQNDSFPGEMSCAADESLATFAAGCFWSVELAYQRLPGVLRTQVGYMGGSVERPAYKAVYAGETGHAEVVQLVYRPKDVSFAELLEVFENKLPTSSSRDCPLRRIHAADACAD